MCFPLSKIVFFFSSFSADILMLFHTHTYTLANRRTRRLLSLQHAPVAFIHAGQRGLTARVRLSGAAAPPGGVRHAGALFTCRS